MTTRRFEQFHDYADLQSFSSLKIGDNLNNPEMVNRSTFKSVSEYIEVYTYLFFGLEIKFRR